MKRISRKAVVCFGLALVMASAWSPGHAAQEEIPLVVGDEYYDPVAGTLEFSLANQGEKLITAWGFLVTAGDGLGNEQVHGLNEDHVKSPHLLSSFEPPPDSETSHPLRPGDVIAYERSIPLSGNSVFHVVSVDVTFVIFDDASAMGDQREIELMYQDRLGMLDATETFLDLADGSRSESWSGDELLTTVENAQALAWSEWEQISHAEKTGGGTRHARVFSRAGQFKSLLGSFGANAFPGLDLGTEDGLREATSVASSYRTLLRMGIPEQLLPLP